MREIRYRYSGPYRELWKARDALESMFAAGEVCNAEFPNIERCKGGYLITLRDNNLSY